MPVQLVLTAMRFFLYAGLPEIDIAVEREWKMLYNQYILAPGNNTK